VRVIRQLGVLLLLLSFIAPGMACALPSAEMTAPERACCRMMKNDCGQMEMSATQGCCRKLANSSDQKAIQVRPAAFHPASVAVMWLAAWELTYRPPIHRDWIRHPEAPASESPPGNITVLRI
jgi:hypothetical protein